MPAYNRTRMCNECPFRRGAPRGWLGPWEPSELAGAVANDEAIICHKDVARRLALGQGGEEIEAEGSHCVGALRYMNAEFKLSRDRERAAVQRRLKTYPDRPTIDPRSFEDYHTLKPAAED